MKEAEFAQWLKDNGLSSYKNYISRINTIEKHYGDIDALFDKDACKSLILDFIYSRDDADKRRTPKHKIPIEPNSDSEKTLYQSYYEGTNDYNSRIKNM